MLNSRHEDQYFVKQTKKNILKRYCKFYNNMYNKLTTT